MKFGTDTYRAGAMERLADATLLLENDRWVGAVYSAGLAVEGMLRSLVRLEDTQFDERHDLRRLATRIENLGLLRRSDADVNFVGIVQDVAVHWHNNLRFSAKDQMIRWWLDMGSVRKRKRKSQSAVCHQFVNQCYDVVRRCEVLWQRQRRASSKKS